VFAGDFFKKQDTMEKSIQIIVKGKVQGVFFRDYTRKKAQSLGLKGTVRNRRDGDVEIVAQGEKSQMKELEQWCWQGSPYSSVTEVTLQEHDHSIVFTDFKVIY
jgi:acylphosphatase